MSSITSTECADLILDDEGGELEGMDAAQLARLEERLNRHDPRCLPASPETPPGVTEEVHQDQTEAVSLPFVAHSADVHTRSQPPPLALPPPLPLPPPLACPLPPGSAGRRAMARVGALIRGPEQAKAAKNTATKVANERFARIYGASPRTHRAGKEQEAAKVMTKERYALISGSSPATHQAEKKEAAARIAEHEVAAAEEEEAEATAAKKAAAQQAEVAEAIL